MIAIDKKNIANKLVPEDHDWLIGRIDFCIKAFIKESNIVNAKNLRTYWEIYKATYLRGGD